MASTGANLRKNRLPHHLLADLARRVAVLNSALFAPPLVEDVLAWRLQTGEARLTREMPGAQWIYSVNAACSLLIPFKNRSG